MERKAQASFEALLAIAAFFCLVAILASHAQRISALLHESAVESSEKACLANEALSLDSAAALSGASLKIGMRAVPSSHGTEISSRISPSATEYLFYRLSYDNPGGIIHVRSSPAEPV